jgi:toxin ParE1/3/4
VADILEVASDELSDAADWYEARQAGYGERFLQEAREAFDRIDRWPLAPAIWKHSGVPDGVRRVFLRTFPYAVVYVVEPRLLIVAVAPFKKHPTYWTDRM